MSSSSFYQSKKNQGLKTLKDYLLEKHAHVYNNFIQNKSNLFGKLNEIKNSKSQNQIEQNQTNKETLYQENIETISVSSNQFGKSKKTYFKVSIYNFMINEPCLIICLEDSSLVQKVQKLETNFLKREDYVNELISFVKQKLSSIIQLSESSTQYLKRQIIQTQIIIQAFLQKLRPVQTSSFMFSEVLEKIKSTYSNYDFQIEGILQNQQIQSDKGFIFITIMCFISALGIENIQLLQTNYIKDKLCEKITLNIQSRYLNQNLEDLNQISLLGLKSFSNLNSGCWQYLKNIMKQICLQDKPQIKLINDDSIMLQIEFMADITVLVQEKKEEQKSILNQICNEKTDLSYSNMVSFSKLPLNQYSSKYCQNKFVPNISFLNSKNKVTQSFMQKLDSSETKNQITINEIQIL